MAMMMTTTTIHLVEAQMISGVNIVDRRNPRRNGNATRNLRKIERNHRNATAATTIGTAAAMMMTSAVKTEIMKENVKEEEDLQVVLVPVLAVRAVAVAQVLNVIAIIIKRVEVTMILMTMVTTTIIVVIIVIIIIVISREKMNIGPETLIRTTIETTIEDRAVMTVLMNTAVTSTTTAILGNNSTATMNNETIVVAYSKNLLCTLKLEMMDRKRLKDMASKAHHLIISPLTPKIWDQAGSYCRRNEKNKKTNGDEFMK
mmetsp:Transcript_52837/g.128114  ORF Transcript_52837/g.128114 Transcript_52837/m.128114 type:complete len:259 (+) Transcript_52837:314-1090(+)